MLSVARVGNSSVRVVVVWMLVWVLWRGERFGGQRRRGCCVMRWARGIGGRSSWTWFWRLMDWVVAVVEVVEQVPAVLFDISAV